MAVTAAHDAERRLWQLTSSYSLNPGRSCFVTAAITIEPRRDIAVKRLTASRGGSLRESICFNRHGQRVPPVLIGSPPLVPAVPDPVELIGE